MSVRGERCRSRGGSTPRLASVLALALVAGAVAWCRSASAEDAPPAPLLPRFERLLPQLREQVATLPPFLRDTDLTSHLRTYYFNRTQPDGARNEALTSGGRLRYRSGWLLDTLAIGATLYGSAPLHAPQDRDGTLLLKPGQEGYYVPGEAWAALRYQDHALLKGYRQLVDQTYINPQDSRMTPNTFEGVTLGGKVASVQYLGGYLWKVKPRNADEFVSMSAQAGAKDSDDGVGLAGVRLTPVPGLRIDVSNQYGVNTFNTLYAEADFLHPLNEDWKLRFGAQITDQRAVGDGLLTAADGKRWATQAGGARIQIIYRALTLTGAFSITAAGNTIQAPWGSFPGYLSLIDQDFDRAREKAWLIGAAYDFSKLLTPGLSANVNFAWGADAINPSTRTKAPNQSEYDFTVDYHPSWLGPTVLRGFWLRARGAILDQEGADRLGGQVRLIVNWERDLF
jgi:hypothetical protein